MLQSPRAHLDAAAKRPELQQVGLYFLVGESDTEDRQLVYVGEAEDCVVRLRQHNKSKDFWRVALAVTSKHTTSLRHT